MLSMETLQERAAAGASFLDERVPGWWERIDGARLDLSCASGCILGQLNGRYGMSVGAVWVRSLETRRLLGWTLSGEGWDEYPDLTDCWRAEITHRRFAALAARKEMEHERSVEGLDFARGQESHKSFSSNCVLG